MSEAEYIYFIWSESLPSACNILFDESSLPVYSTSIGLYKQPTIARHAKTTNSKVIQWSDYISIWSFAGVQIGLV